MDKSRNSVSFRTNSVCGEKRVCKWKCCKNWRCRTTFKSSDVEKKTPLWREARFEVQMYKTPQLRTAFWSSDVERLHAAVARSAFSSQNAQNTPAPDRFLKFWCRKVARCCGEKRIFKSKCTKHLSSGPLFEVRMSKNCAPLWREARLQVNVLKNWRCRATFWSSDVEKLHATVVRSACVSQNAPNTCVLARFSNFRCRKIAKLVSKFVSQ